MKHQTVSESTQNADDVTDSHGIKSSQEPLHLESSRQNKCDIKGFLKRNTFVLLTIAAIATGKSKKSVCLYMYTLYVYTISVNVFVFNLIFKLFWLQNIFYTLHLAWATGWSACTAYGAAATTFCSISRMCVWQKFFFAKPTSQQQHTFQSFSQHWHCLKEKTFFFNEKAHALPK